LSNERLVRLIGLLLIAIGALLLWEAVFPFQYASLIPASAPVHLFAGLQSAYASDPSAAFSASLGASC
jgi:hypothetical protein